MNVVSIQVARPRRLDVAGRNITTGIFKEPVAAAEVTAAGLAGDAVINTRHHGGPDQAVYVYSAADYRWWRTELDRDLPSGAFGENLTLSTFGEGRVMIGDRWHIGGVVLETTAPRIPCATFGTKMGDAAFPARFRAAQRPGFYARVIAPGEIRPGMVVTRENSAGSVTLLELFDLAYDTAAAPGRLESALQAPLAGRARADIERRLDRLR
jgi:MOSC domain-containing protein YiiM